MLFWPNLSHLMSHYDEIKEKIGQLKLFAVANNGNFPALDVPRPNVRGLTWNSPLLRLIVGNEAQVSERIADQRFEILEFFIRRLVRPSNLTDFTLI